MTYDLTDLEARVIGCLMEKSVLTPDQYPLTLNALTNACNQKSSREPVMSLDQVTVQRTVRALKEKHLVQIEENFRSQVEKYNQRLCNTLLSELQLEPAQFAVICVLLLRGPRTPGELRANSGRLHTFADNEEVVETLRTLMEREGDALVCRLPRVPGRRDAQYMHLLSGPVEAAQEGVELPAAAAPRAASVADRLARMEAKDAIRELAARYCHAVVDGDVEALVDLFTEDGVFRSGAQAPAGHEALRAFYAPLAEQRYKPFVQNHVIEFGEDDAATGRCSVEIRVLENGEAYTQAGHYHDRYRCVDGCWKFAERHYVRYHHAPWREGWSA